MQFVVRPSSCLCMSFISRMVEYLDWHLGRRFVCPLLVLPASCSNFFHIIITCKISPNAWDRDLLQSFLIVSDPSIAKHILKDNPKNYSKVFLYVNLVKLCWFLLCILMLFGCAGYFSWNSWLCHGEGTYTSWWRDMACTKAGYSPFVAYEGRVTFASLHGTFVFLDILHCK